MSQDSPEIRIRLPRGAIRRAVAIYAVIALLILPALSTLMDLLFVPEWIARWLVVALVVGLGVTALTAWVRDRSSRSNSG